MITDAKIFFAYLALTVLLTLNLATGAGLGFGLGFVAFGMVAYTKIFVAAAAGLMNTSGLITSRANCASKQILARYSKYRHNANNCYNNQGFKDSFHS